MQKLTEGQSSNCVSGKGLIHVLIIGKGTACIQKSIGVKDAWYPVTDSYGKCTTLVGKSDDSLMLNSEIKTTCQVDHYRVKCIKGNIKVNLVKQG